MEKHKPGLVSMSGGKSYAAKWRGVLEKYMVEETKKVPGRCKESHQVADL